MAIFDKFKQAEFDEMKRIEQAIIKALQPFKATSDPLLALIALIRCARVMLRLGDQSAQRQLLPVVEDFLRGRTNPRGQGILWMPGDES